MQISEVSAFLTNQSLSIFSHSHSFLLCLLLGSTFRVILLLERVLEEEVSR